MVLSSRDFVSPPEVVATTAAFFGGEIDLDPASSEHANQVVQATRYFTWQNNGLTQTWKAKNIYLYPPRDFSLKNEQPKDTRLFTKIRQFRKSSQRVWLELAYHKWLRKEFDQAIIFLTSSEVALIVTQKLGLDFPMCILKERPKLLVDEPELTPLKQAKVFGFILYLPSVTEQEKQISKFAELYSNLGRIYY
jgi:hypothetical protein